MKHFLIFMIICIVFSGCRAKNFPKIIDIFVDETELKCDSYSADDWEASYAEFEKLTEEYTHSERSYTDAERQLVARAIGRYDALLLKQKFIDGAAYIEELVQTIPEYVDGLGGDYPIGEGLSEEEKSSISDLIKAVRSGDRDFVASSIHYPINRIYPLPSIESKEEFLRNYDSYFSQDIISSISNKTWARVGWRGITCDDGIFWGEIEEDGVFRINRFRPTPRDLEERELLFEQQRTQLHPSIAEFKEQVIAIKTAKFKIRIDKLDDGKMRYAAWRISDDFSAKPSLVIRGGEYWTEGSIGYPYYMFKTEDYTYLISDSYEPEYDYNLEVFKGNSLTKENYLHEDAIMSEKAYIIP